jgi:GST-like protein
MRTAYDIQEFLAVHEYPNVGRWVEMIGTRPAVARGQMVNRFFGPLESQLRERHNASDFEHNREDMVQARGGNRI